MMSHAPDEDPCAPAKISASEKTRTGRVGPELANAPRAKETERLPHQFDTRCWAPGCTSACTPEQLRNCGSCKVAKYCSEKCQDADWKAHRVRCKSCADMASVAKNVVHPRCVLPLQENSFPPNVRGYITSSTGHGERLGKTSWHFTKLEDGSRQRWFLERGLGLRRREEWMRLLDDPSCVELEVLSKIWQLFYCDNRGFLTMVSCESPFLNTETPEPVLPVRDQLRVISRVKQASIVALGSTIGLGVVFQRQPNTKTRKALVGHDAAIKIYEDIALTPVSPYHAIMPTDKFVQW